MGHRITQRIYECSRCGKIPEDGEHMWHMSNEVWCKECIEKDDEESSETETEEGSHE